MVSGSAPKDQPHPVDRILVTASPAAYAPRSADAGGSAFGAVPPAPRPPAAHARPASTSVQAALRDLQAAVLGDQAHVALAPEVLAAVARHAPLDLTAYHLSRIAAWALPRHRLDRRFVALTLLVDQGAAATTERWRAEPRRFDDLADVFAATGAPALVLLGRPGAGKSTLLRRLEIDSAIESLRTGGPRVTFHVPLNGYRADGPGGTPAGPPAWLCERWLRLYPRLPDLERLLADCRVLLLLDGLNELPHRDAADYRRHVEAWKECLHAVVEQSPDNRVVFACRSLDYSAPLSRAVRAHARREPSARGSDHQRLDRGWVRRRLRSRRELDAAPGAGARRAAADRARREAEAAAALAKRLDALVRRGAAAWRDVEQRIERTQPQAYDEAVAMLRDLRALAERDHKLGDLQHRLAALRQRHAKKRAFIGRLDRAGFG